MLESAVQSDVLSPRELYLPIAQLQFDRSYQRDLKKHLIKAIASALDDVLLDRIWVNLRASGENFVVDGQQRCHAARMAGRIEILCLLFNGLSYKEEVSYYYEHNTSSVPLTALEKFRAGFYNGRISECAIYEAVHAFDGSIAGIDKEGNAIIAVRSLQDVYAQGGDIGIRGVLQAIKDSFGEVSKATAISPLVKGIYMVLSRHQDELDYERLARRLSEVGSDALRRKAANLAQGQANPKSVYLAVVTEYNYRLRAKNQIDPRLRDKP